MGTRPWVPEHPVDEALARRLIAEQFPDLAGLPLLRVGFGWDMDVWRVGDWAFRFPRRTLGVDLVDVEVRVLTGLAPRLSLPIPLPERVGRPSEAFAFPFYGHRFLAGRPVERARPDAAARSRLAPQVARFLRTLHALPPADARALGVPEDTFRGRLDRHAERALARLENLPEGPWQASRAAARSLLTALPPSRADGEPLLLHGDLYARHLLLDETGDLAGVIDWGDVCLGDPALDLSIAYTLLPPEARSEFWAAYGPVDAATQDRARLLGLARYGIALLTFAIDVADADLTREAGLALSHATT